MTTTALLQEAASYQEQLVRTRRFLHTHPGTGFDIQETVDYVKAGTHFHGLRATNVR